MGNHIPAVGDKYLVTTSAWFFAPDGEQYRAVFGTVNGILDDESTLGIKTNRHSSNWYLSIGNVIIAGCQIHYAIRTDKVSTSPVDIAIDHAGKRKIEKRLTASIYIADG